MIALNILISFSPYRFPDLRLLLQIWNIFKFYPVFSQFYSLNRYAPHNDVSVNDGLHIRRCSHKITLKCIPQQAEVAQGVWGRLRPRIILTFRQSNAPTVFTPGKIPGTQFQRLSRPQGTWFCGGTTEKIPSDTTGNRSPDRPTSSAAP